MFDLSKYSNYDKWLNIFTEVSARLGTRETALVEVRHLRESRGVFDEQILVVLKRQGV
jgi:hypothetical protein